METTTVATAAPSEAGEVNSPKIEEKHGKKKTKIEKSDNYLTVFYDSPTQKKPAKMFFGKRIPGTS